MNRIIFFIVCLSFQVVTAQRLTLSELHTFASNKNWESTNKNLISQGWEYFESTESDSIGYNEITWSFKRNDYTEKANGWFHVYNIEGLPNKIMYRFRQKEYYTLLIKNLVSAGYKQTNEEIMNDRVVAYYSNPSYYLQISYNKEENSDDDYSYYSSNKIYTVYEVSLFKKGGFYDPNNGFKTDYDEYGAKTATYSLKNGEMEGLYTSYDSIGRVSEKTNYKKGSKEGVNIQNIYFDNEDGVYLELRGNYVADLREGKWIGELVNGISRKKVIENNYLNDKKEGVSLISTKSKVLLENFKNDELNGVSKSYFTENDEIVSLDNYNDKNLYLEQYYENNKLNGSYKFYDKLNSLIEEGQYKDSLKVGVWKNYYANYFDANKNLQPFSKQLVLESNFENDKLNGEQKRYSFIDKVEKKCLNDVEKDPYDGKCYLYFYSAINEVSNYKNNLLHGLYTLKDSLGNPIETGNYRDDKREGEWTEHNKSKINDWLFKETFEKGYYYSGMKEDNWQRFDSDNNLLESYFYDKDLLSGECKIYQKNKVNEIKYFASDNFIKHNYYDEFSKLYKTYYLKDIMVNSVDVEVITNTSQFITKENYNYTISKKDISPINFTLNFVAASSTYKKRNGLFEKKNVIDKIVEKGTFKYDVKIGQWDYYFYEQNVLLTINYNYDGTIEKETYYDLKKNEPFSGEFDYINNETNEFEERKIKQGVRNGNTRYKDKDGKTIKKESYKDGVLKE